MKNSKKETAAEFVWQDLDDMASDDAVSNDDLFAQMIARQREFYGPDIKEPCEEALELLEQWTADTSEDCVMIWRGHVARQTPGAGPKDSCERWNDAKLTGAPCEAWDALLTQTVQITAGRVFTDKERKRESTRDEKWGGNPFTWGAIIAGTPGKSAVFARERRDPWGLSRHIEDASKDGAGYVFGNCLTYRRAGAVTSVCALVIDADTGHVSFDDAVKIAQKLGYAFIGHTSHSHLTTETDLRRDDVVKHADCSGDPSLEQVRAYASEKKKLAPHIVDSIIIKDARTPTADGEMIVIEHAPIEKYRLIFPLSEGDVKLADLANTQKEAQEIHAGKVRGLSDMLGIPTDPATLDVSRFFYAPRHKNGAEHRTVIHRAPPIKYADVIAISDRKEKTGTAYKRRPEVITADGTNVTQLYDDYAKRWMLAEIAEHADLGTSVAADNGGGKFHVRCPFADGHTESADDGATFAMNAEDAQNGYAVVKCLHGSCAHRHAVEYIAAWIDSGDLDPAMLIDASYMSPLPDDAVGEKFAQATPKEIDDGTVKEDPHKWATRAGYKVKDGAIWKKGSETDTKICQIFEVLGRSSNLTGDSDAGRIITFNNENGVIVEVTLDRADLFKSDGGGVIDVLARAGMEFHFGGRNGRSDFLDLLRAVKSNKRIPVARQGGWTQDQTGRVTGFLAPTGEYFPAQNDAPEMRLHSTAMVKDGQAHGTLENWKAAASAAHHNFFWQFGLCAGFVGPVLGLIEGATCGVNFSGASSKGKTIALMLGTSCWATLASGMGLFNVMNSTPNAVEDLLTTASGATAGLDEIGAMQNTGDLTSMLFGASSGSGKSRKAGRGAGLAETAHFRTFVMTSHERSLKTTIKNAGGDYKTGLSVRFPDIDVTENKIVDADVLAQLDLMKTNYGHAGPAFVRYLIKDRWHERKEELKARVSAAVDDIAGPDAAPALRRAAYVFALVQVAGLLAADAGLIEARPIKTAIKKAFSTFKTSDEGRATEGGEAILDSLRSWITLNMGKGLIPAAEAGEPGYGDVRGWYTDDLIILDYERFADTKGMRISGTREDAMAALAKIKALVKSGKNNKHNALPECVKADAAAPADRRARNVRIFRKVLGV